MTTDNDVCQECQEILRRVVMDYGNLCHDPDECSCSLAQAVHYFRKHPLPEINSWPGFDR